MRPDLLWIASRRGLDWRDPDVARASYLLASWLGAWTLPGHMLITPEDEGRPGVHWDVGEA